MVGNMRRPILASGRGQPGRVLCTPTPSESVSVDRLLLTEREAARRLNVSRFALYTLRREGKIGYVPLGRAVRYTVDQLAAWIASTRKDATNGQR